MIYRYRDKYPIQEMCEFFQVSRSGYYAWKDRMDRKDCDSAKKELVMSIWERSHRTYGYRRITAGIRREQGQQINHKAVLRLMQVLGIRSVARKRRTHKQWLEKTLPHRYPNVLNQDFQAGHPNQKWVTDITYIPTDQGTLYLSVIKDLYDGFIVAYHTSAQNTLELVTTTLNNAFQMAASLSGLILHSDQGGQYRSHHYFSLIQKMGVSPSMSRPGNCWDNAPIENFFSHLKEESIRQVKLKSIHQAQEVIADYIYFYNYERIQLKTRLTPYELRCQSM